MSLFTVPVPPCGAHPGGSITATQPQPQVYLLTFVSPPDNRLTTALCRALLQALDILEFGGYTPGVVVTTSGIPKFYSNGLDLEHAINTDGFWQLFFDLWTRLLTQVVPDAHGRPAQRTHLCRRADARAGARLPPGPGPQGLPVPQRGALRGAAQAAHGRHLPAPPGAAGVPHRGPRGPPLHGPAGRRGRRFTGQQAVEYGLADATAASLDDALRFIDERQLTEKAKAGVYGVIKTELHKDLLRELRKEGVDREEARFNEDQRREGERKEFGKVWFEQWNKENKSKL
ncbi:3,2-trans-enoyl-CoA isomerase precursor, putative [Metarhizium acridum CQMa 102]|uniref:3,2-trans-enoyl-CoA isomerase, putative n=1 Tax=Metarhizium acridum (strain CQMa 102) TaxID=655827 RepID=E9E7E6_METAQ|nr:3,2-trans-enoyl-CoA isomerase precursor, putative [Metarhizium acridum CQMa 102]EFY88188.1 3,2-trans-enoyl-CoA isomerase precursor, putative [Metarhizium acridum CQMa 102]